MCESFKKTSVPNPYMGITSSEPPRNFAYAKHDGNPNPYPDKVPATSP